jgi:hypothetical protein
MDYENINVHSDMHSYLLLEADLLLQAMVFGMP